MNRKTGEKRFERAWTNYHLFARRAEKAENWFVFCLKVVRNGVAPECPPGFYYVAVLGGNSMEEAWDEFCRVRVDLRQFIKAPAGDPGPGRAEPQPAML